MKSLTDWKSRHKMKQKIVFVYFLKNRLWEEEEEEEELNVKWNLLGFLPCSGILPIRHIRNPFIVFSRRRKLSLSARRGIETWQKNSPTSMRIRTGKQRPTHKYEIGRGGESSSQSWIQVIMHMFILGLQLTFYSPTELLERIIHVHTLYFYLCICQTQQLDQKTMIKKFVGEAWYGYPSN